MINSIKIENLRSLKDTGFIKLKRLNVLLGTNSSGKSTFIRSFPLFLQSINKNLRGPISWFDDSFVDFGDYQTAKNKYSSTEDCIKFSFDIQLSRPLSLVRNFDYQYNTLPQKEFYNKNIKVSISYSNDSEGTFISAINIIYSKDINCLFKINKRSDFVKIIVNDTNIDFVKWKWNQNTHHGMLPSNEKTKVGEYLIKFETWLEGMIIKFIQNHCDKRLTKIERLQPIIKNWSQDKNAFLDYLQNQINITSFKRSISHWDINNEGFNKFYYSLTAYNLISMLPLINTELTHFYENCSYIAPMRAEANRYYRSQGLQVNEVDSYGRNLQEFISSLTPNQSKSYNDFCKNLLGIQVMTVNTAGHYSIMLKKENDFFNMADVGFGYSQVLPIITKLWFSNFTNLIPKPALFLSRYINKNTILVEQPELHLHPAMQAKLADAFIQSTKQTDEEGNQKDSRLIIETHSQAIINRIGRRIREGIIDSDDINIILFQKDPEYKNSIIKQISFNKEGRLTEWPYGFFDPND